MKNKALAQLDKIDAKKKMNKINKKIQDTVEKASITFFQLNKDLNNKAFNLSFQLSFPSKVQESPFKYCT